MSREVPKGFDPAATYAVVVTMGCGEACPVYLGARYEDWQFDDPKGQDEATVLRIVADIDQRVRRLLAELLPGHDLPPSVFEPEPQEPGGVSRRQFLGSAAIFRRTSAMSRSRTAAMSCSSAGAGRAPGRA